MFNRPDFSKINNYTVVLLTFLGLDAVLPCGICWPRAAAGIVVVDEAGWAWGLVGDSIDAVDELVAYTWVGMPEEAVSSGATFRLLWFLCNRHAVRIALH